MTTQQPRDDRSARPLPGASSHDEDTSGTSVAPVFWAGAKALAGVSTETWRVDTVGAALQAAADQRQDPRFDRLLRVCTVLVDGVVVRPERLGDRLSGAVRAEVLPPFAGGAA